jgi:hypothetical protein
MKLIAIYLIILCLCGVVFLMAQAPAPADINDPAHETVRLRLVTSFQRALLAQQVKLRADADFDAARSEYTALADQTAAELKLPKGSEFIIDQKGTVQVKMPPPTPAPPAPVKPAEPAPETKPEGKK